MGVMECFGPRVIVARSAHYKHERALWWQGRSHESATAVCMARLKLDMHASGYIGPEHARSHVDDMANYRQKVNVVRGHVVCMVP